MKHHPQKDPATALLPLVLLAPVISPIYLLLQHDAIHTSLEQRKRQARLALQVAQPVEDLGAGVRCEVVERGR